MTQTLLNVQEVAAALSASRASIWRWAKNGDIPAPVKLAGASRWRADDIKQHIAGLAPAQ